MKLHLPKTLLMAVVAACLTLPVAQAEGIGYSYDSTYTYSGTVYTLDADTAHATATGTLSTKVYETTRDATKPTGWTVSDTDIVTTDNTPATDDEQRKNWQNIMATDTRNTTINTFRITGNGTYGYMFNGLTAGSLIVEAGSGGSIVALNGASGDSDRNISIGRNDSTAVNSYFGDSFTISDIASGTKTSTVFTLRGTQDWYIADGKTVTLQTKGTLKNTGTLTVNGGTLSVNKTIQNTGTVNGTNATLFVSDINALDERVVETTSGLAEKLASLQSNDLIDVAGKFTVISGGSTNFTQFSYEDADGATQTATLTNGVSDVFTMKAYGVVTDSTLADIASSVNSGGTGIIALKEGVTLSAGSGATFTKTQALGGTGTYALGAVTAADVYKGMNMLDFKGLITADTGADGFNLTNFNNVNQAAKLELSNFTGYLCSSNGGTLHTNLILEKTEGATYALKLKNGTSTTDRNTTFAGSIEGDGDMAYIWTNDSQNKQTHIFQGDTSGWKGKFVRDADNNGKHTVAKFTAGGNVFHSDGTGGVENKNATSMMSVIIESTKDTTFNGSISNVSSVAVNSNTSFEQNVSTGALNVKEAVTLSVAAGIRTETLTLGTGSQLEFAGGAITIANDYTVDAACIVLADDISFDSEEDYTLITVGNSTNASIATLSDATLTVTGLDTWSGNGTIYTINNVDYAAKLVQDNNSLKLSFTAMPVPEPTTATLSLLALAGLAVRRRRK